MKRPNRVNKGILLPNPNLFFSFLLSMSLLLIVMSCNKDGNNNNDSTAVIMPKGAKPAWGPTLTPQMQTVVEKLEQLTDTTPIHALTVAQARSGPSAADAAMAVQNDYGIPTPASAVDTSGVEIPVTGGSIHARIYTPRTGKSAYPVIVYYHGEGFVIATINTYNSSAQAFAEKVDAVVVSVEYRKAPEFPFPTAHDDAYAAYLWVLNNGASIKADTSKIAVAGESAGGSLAAATSMKAALSGIKVPLYQVLVYPVANNDTTTASATQYKDAIPLGRTDLTWFYEKYTPVASQGDDPRISLVDMANLSVMPPTTIIAAQIDPLQTEGKLLADNMTAAGVTVDYQLYIGVTHEFFGMNTVLPEAKAAEDHASSKLKDALK